MLPRVLLAAVLALSATFAAMTLPATALAQSEGTESTTDGTTNGGDQGEKKATEEKEPEC